MSGLMPPRCPSIMARNRCPSPLRPSPRQTTTVPDTRTSRPSQGTPADSEPPSASPSSDLPNPSPARHPPLPWETAQAPPRPPQAQPAHHQPCQNHRRRTLGSLLILGQPPQPALPPYLQQFLLTANAAPASPPYISSAAAYHAHPRLRLSPPFTLVAAFSVQSRLRQFPAAFRALWLRPVHPWQNVLHPLSHGSPPHRQAHKCLHLALVCLPLLRRLVKVTGNPVKPICGCPFPEPAISPHYVGSNGTAHAVGSAIFHGERARAGSCNDENQPATIEGHGMHVSLTDSRR